MGVCVITDSSHYLPRELVARLGLREVSLYVGWGGELEREADITDLAAFYARLREAPDLPATSQPSVGDFEACFEPLVAQGTDVVSIHIASGISGTFGSASEASRILAERGHPGRIAVVDSQSGAAGLGLLLLQASETAGRGADLDTITADVQRARASLGMWFCLDTLEYLRRGGRIGAAQALLGSTLQIKPILTFGREITPVGRVRTTKRAFARMVEYLGELEAGGIDTWAVQHIGAPAEADRLVAEGVRILGREPAFCGEVGPVLGTHLGPGMLGVAGIRTG